MEFLILSKEKGGKMIGWYFLIPSFIGGFAVGGYCFYRLMLLLGKVNGSIRNARGAEARR